MISYLLKRVLLMIPTLLGITIVIFSITRFAPGDPAQLLAREQGGGGGVAANQSINEEIIRQNRRLFDLDKPLHMQYLLWMKRAGTGNFGKSMRYKEPVLALIGRRLRVSIELALISFILSYLIALPAGIHSAVRQYRWDDRAVTTVLFVLYSLPSFWVATMLMLIFGVGGWLEWLPLQGLHGDDASAMAPLAWFGDHLVHLLLPVACLTYGSFAFLSRQMRSSMLEQVRSDYVRTARAKGLSERVVILKHALRNSMIPILTLLSALLPALISGSIIIESVFQIQGIGLLTWEAIGARDYPVIQAILTFSALLTLLGILMSDVLYAVVDPRISFD